ncbi:MAG: glycosyltransferase [Thermodesulfobacteriota bacterium]
MNILFCTNRNPHFLTITEYVESALRQLGHQVRFHDDRNFRLPGRLRRLLPPLERWELGRINRGLLDGAAAFGPDLVLVAGGHRIFPDTVRRLAAKDIATALWTIDAPINFAPVLAAAPRYDHVFCGGSEAIDLLAAAGVRATWLPFACDAEMHRPASIDDDDRKCYGSRICTVGSFYPNRLAAIEQLADFDVRAWGPGWQRLDACHPLAARCTGGELPPAVWKKIFQASDIVLVVHYQDGRTPCRQASPKIYEAMACGAFVLSDDQPDVTAQFDAGVHLDVFRDPDELRRKAAWYLDHPEERRRIAAAGQQLVRSRHTYTERMGRLLARIGG